MDKKLMESMDEILDEEVDSVDFGSDALTYDDDKDFDAEMDEILNADDDEEIEVKDPADEHAKSFEDEMNAVLDDEPEEDFEDEDDKAEAAFWAEEDAKDIPEYDNAEDFIGDDFEESIESLTATEKKLLESLRTVRAKKVELLKK